jgi:hypothetical protein
MSSKASGLITDPSAAKAELELDQPATKREVIQAINNFHLQNVHPMFAGLAKTLEGNFQGIRAEFGRVEKQRDQVAVIFNGLVDFLEQRGLRQTADGRYILNPQEFEAFLKRRADVGQQHNSPPRPTDA